MMTYKVKAQNPMEIPDIKVLLWYLLWKPELVPQITGEPWFPGDVTKKESSRQSPRAVPKINNNNLFCQIPLIWFALSLDSKDI